MKLQRYKPGLNAWMFTMFPDDKGAWCNADEAEQAISEERIATDASIKLGQEALQLTILSNYGERTKVVELKNLVVEFRNMVQRLEDCIEIGEVPDLIKEADLLLARVNENGDESCQRER